MKKIRTILAAAALAGAALAGSAVPALASARVAFAVQDNNGVLVTRYPLVVKQKFTCAGVEYTVQTVQGGHGSETITVTPLFPASDDGKTVPCTT